MSKAHEHDAGAKEDVALSARLRVESVLKGVVEAELARRGTIEPIGSAAYFSRGVIFSKSGNGTPFSRGVIFSKSGREMINELKQEQLVMEQMVSLDEAAFQDFATRLTRLKQTKGIG